jgi:hypothetical protein
MKMSLTHKFGNEIIRLNYRCLQYNNVQYEINLGNLKI